MCSSFQSGLISKLVERLGEREEVMEELLEISSYLPQQSTLSFYNKVVEEFEQLKSDGESGNYLMILRSLYNWKKQSLVIKTISKNISKVMESKKITPQLLDKSNLSFQLLSSFLLLPSLNSSSLSSNNSSSFSLTSCPLLPPPPPPLPLFPPLLFFPLLFSLISSFICIILSTCINKKIKKLLKMNRPEKKIARLSAL